MAEIKSTLDLVLEKTKGLALDKEDKLKYAREELDKKVHGFVVRYLDNFLSMSRLREEMEKIDKKEQELAYKLLAKHLLAHFNLDADNNSIVSALSGLANFDTTSLATLQKEHHEEKEEARKTLNATALQALEKRGISGSSVVPNLNNAPEWDQLLHSLRKKYRERLHSIESD